MNRRALTESVILGVFLLVMLGSWVAQLVITVIMVMSGFYLLAAFALLTFIMSIGRVIDAARLFYEHTIDSN